MVKSWRSVKATVSAVGVPPSASPSRSLSGNTRTGTVVMPCSLCAGRLEQLDEVAGGVAGEDLGSAGPGHDLVAESNSLRGEAGDFAIEVVDDEVDAVPTSRGR